MLLLLKQNLKTGLHIRLNNSFYVSIVAPDRSKLSGGHGATSVGQVINLYWMSLGGILFCITGDCFNLMVNFDSIAITSKVVCLFVFLIPIFSIQVLKPCLLTWGSRLCWRRLWCWIYLIGRASCQPLLGLFQKV